jgi:hypothetical protein
MLQNRIEAFIKTGFAHGPASPPDPRYVIPIIGGMFYGIVVARVTPGVVLEIPIPRNRAWLIIIDDLAPGAAGPGSFEPETMDWLLSDASLVAIDSAEPEPQRYRTFVRDSVMGNRFLVVQTTPECQIIWRELLRERWTGMHLSEFMPAPERDDQTVHGFLARFGERE